MEILDNYDWMLTIGNFHHISIILWQLCLGVEVFRVHMMKYLKFVLQIRFLRQKSYNTICFFYGNSWRKIIMSTLMKWHLVHYILTKFEKGLSEPEKHYIMCCVCDCMVVGFTTTYAISAYHHCSCEFESPSWRDVFNTTLCNKVCQWLVTGQWFSPGTLVSSTNKTDCHEISEILLKVVLNTNRYLVTTLKKLVSLYFLLFNSYC